MKNENYWKKHYLNPEEVSENEKTLAKNRAIGYQFA